MCRCLRIQFSGFYAWLKSALSKCAREDVRQTNFIRKAWDDSGKVYGYRKLHDDLLDQGETSCPNRVARLAGLAGIKALIGYKRRLGSYGGKPSVVVDNKLARQFDVAAPDRAWVTDITYIRTMEGFAYLAVVIDLFSRRAGAAHGGVAQEAEGQRPGPLRPRLPLHQHGLGSIPEAPQS
jgi:putative transposase